jgi:acetyl-CoA acetyltransferase
MAGRGIERTLRGRVAVVGIGETNYYRHGASPDPEFKLALKAIVNACNDAGLDPRDIDGFASYSDDRSEASRLAAALGIHRLRAATMQWGGGGGGCCAAVANAAAAIVAGLADCVVVFRSLAQGQYGRFGQTAYIGTISGERAYLMPYGVLAPPQRFAMRVQRYIHEFGIRQQALRAIALASYHHAQANPRAVMYGKPLDEPKYDASRWIAEPFHLYDCCMENDGAAALVLVAAERASEFRHKPVYVLGAAAGSGYRTGAIAHNSPRYASASFDTVAPELYRMAGLGPSDVGVVQAYENFTGGVAMALAEHGFFKPDEANEFLTLRKPHCAVWPASAQHQRRQSRRMLHAWLRTRAGGRTPGPQHLDEPGATKRRGPGDRRSDGHARQQSPSRFGRDIMSDNPGSSYLPAGLPIPVAEPDGLSAPYWEGLRKGRLLVQRCSHCQTWQFGPEWLCHRCHAFDPEWIEIAPRGRIFSWKRVWHPPRMRRSGNTVPTLPCLSNCHMPAVCGWWAIYWAIQCRKLRLAQTSKASSSIIETRIRRTLCCNGECSRRPQGKVYRMIQKGPAPHLMRGVRLCFEKHALGLRWSDAGRQPAKTRSSLQPRGACRSSYGERWRRIWWSSDRRSLEPRTRVALGFGTLPSHLFPTISYLVSRVR